jgi:hypothetical protein
MIYGGSGITECENSGGDDLRCILVLYLFGPQYLFYLWLYGGGRHIRELPYMQEQSVRYVDSAPTVSFTMSALSNGVAVNAVK